MYLNQSSQLESHTGNLARDLARSSGLLGAMFVAAHAPLALLMGRATALVTVHALAVLMAGLILAARGRQPQRVAYVAAYIMGAEVLWRMTGLPLFWEFGKYAVVLIMGIAMLRQGRLRGPLLPLAYFALLLPSIVLTMAQMSPQDARQQISFNLSGPLALFICAWFFSHQRLSGQQITRLFAAALGPIIGIATLALFGIVRAESISFTGESNFATSGGFGPNQVSAMLGLGALICFWRLLWARSGCGARLASAGLMLGLATQSALTFSRGGLYMAGGSAVLAALYLARDTRSRLRLVLIAALVGLAAHYVIIPGLDSFTGGALTQRFTDTGATGRFEIVSADLQVWQQSPLLGSGPGGARAAEETERFFGHAAAAHTEFARLLAEHGALGMGGLMVLTIMSLRNLRRAPTVQARALVISLLGWSLLFMATSAMRVVAPALLFGATFMAIEAPELP